jgi:VIT family
MHESIPGPRIIHRYFAPEDRLAEVICGLIMVLTFTATVGGTFEGTTPHALLIAVFGCNIAWGIVDGATYVFGNLMSRGARSRLIATVRRTPDDPKVTVVVASRLEGTLGDLLTSEQHQQVLRWILDGASRVEPEPTRLRKEDLYTGLACFLIVFVATIPVVLPFLFIKNDAHALRACNGLILVLLFVTGWRWAAFANMNRLKTGLALLAVGFVLMIITVALGG